MRPPDVWSHRAAAGSGEATKAEDPPIAALEAEEAAPTTGRNAAKNKKKREKAKLKKASNEEDAGADDEPPPLISDVSQYEAQLGGASAVDAAEPKEAMEETMDETERDLINKILGFTV